MRRRKTVYVDLPQIWKFGQTRGEFVSPGTGKSTVLKQ